MLATYSLDKDKLVRNANGGWVKYSDVQHAVKLARKVIEADRQALADAHTGPRGLNVAVLRLAEYDAALAALKGLTP